MISPNRIRKHVLDMVYNKKSGHIGSSFSIAELISVLYSDYNINEVDKLILSKGHAVPAIYAVLYEMGKLTKEDIDSFREVNSALQGHPDKIRLKYIDATTGSLGQGLSIAIGHSIGKNMKKEDGKVFCILGDGEIQEGQVWEALMYYPMTKLNNLICFIDYNKYQSDNFTNKTIGIYDNLQNIISSFGWLCESIDGHDVNEIRRCLSLDSDKPLCIILNTIKGKGVSFMEAQNYHSGMPNEEEYKLALKELNT